MFNRYYSEEEKRSVFMGQMTTVEDNGRKRIELFMKQMGDIEDRERNFYFGALFALAKNGERDAIVYDMKVLKMLGREDEIEKKYGKVAGGVKV